MIIAKAYQMLLSAHDTRSSGTQLAVNTGSGVAEPWLAAGIYRAVSRTADLIERIGSRGIGRR